MATSRIIVEEPLYDAFCEKLTKRARSSWWETRRTTTR